MSLNTRCPACETVFKVVPDQLKVSGGWVRCGRCSEVFDAATHMLPPVSTPADTAANALPLKTSSAPKAVDQSSQLVEQVAATPQPASSPPPPAPPSPAEMATSRSDRQQDLPAAANIGQTPQTELSFVRDAKNKAFWQQPRVVYSLLFLLAGFTALLLFQVIVDQRHQLAAAYPRLQASLERLCKPLGCTIEAVKQLDALKIESSTFQKIQESAQGDTFALKVTLKNNATLPLAVPALELSLTDVNDKAVLRRVLLAQELGFHAKTLGTSEEWSGSVSIFVSPQTAPNRPQQTIAGYRLLAFYP